MQEIIQKVCDRVYTNGLRFKGKIPASTTDVDGKYILINGGGWTDSFFVGMVYLCYAYTNNKKFLKIADAYQDFYRKRALNTPQICEREKFLPLDHDTGFIFLLSQVLRYQLTGDVEAKSLALSAADILAGRYNEQGKFIRAWDTWEWDTDPSFVEEKKGKIIVDSMMNIPLLLWAYEQTGEERMKEIALNHAATVAQYIVRGDGSTYHQYNFNAETGVPIGGKTGQGYDDESCWSRGQAWALYGFTQLYNYTKDEVHLNIAKKVCGYFIHNLTNTNLPLWDFSCAKLPFRPYDSSAAAIALSAMVDLYGITQEHSLLKKAEQIKTALLSQCNALKLEGWDAILLHACGGPAYRKGKEQELVSMPVDGPIIYGDYYFLEALLKMEKLYRV